LRNPFGERQGVLQSSLSPLQNQEFGQRKEDFKTAIRQDRKIVLLFFIEICANIQHVSGCHYWQSRYFKSVLVSWRTKNEGLQMTERRGNRPTAADMGFRRL
jgi:hypothetical protein